MQVGSFRPYSLRHDTMGTIERINVLSAWCRKNDHMVIFIQHDGSKEDIFLPGTADWEILPELDRHPSDITVSKTANDSFYNTRLQELLDNNNITELLITGCATDFCVDTTIKSAHSKDYAITVVEEAHTTAARPHIDAPTVIKHYNWLWADMSATKHKIKVVSTDMIISGNTPS